MDDVKTRPARAEAIQAALAAQKALAHSMFHAHASQWVDLKLPLGQLKALMTLASGATTVSGLAKTLNVRLPAASILVDQLVTSGYAERAEDPADRRRTLVTPTWAGSDLATRLHQVGPDRFRRWLEQLDDGDLAAYARGASALAAIAEHDAAETDIASA